MEWNPLYAGTIHSPPHSVRWFRCETIWALAWTQMQWPPDWQEMNIATKELVLIVAGRVLWALHWHGAAVHCNCDNWQWYQHLNQAVRSSPVP